MRRPGEVLSRLELLEHAWDFGYENRSNVIDVYVRYLREKVDRPVRGDEPRDRARRRLPAARRRRRRLSRLPIRIRLTLAFTLVMAVVLVAVGLFVYSRVAATSTPPSTPRCAGAPTTSPRPPRAPAAPRPDEPRLVARDESLAQVIGRDGRAQLSSPGLGHTAVLTPTSWRAPGAGRSSSTANGVGSFDEHLRLLARPRRAGRSWSSAPRARTARRRSPRSATCCWSACRSRCCSPRSRPTAWPARRCAGQRDAARGGRDLATRERPPPAGAGGPRRARPARRHAQRDARPAASGAPSASAASWRAPATSCARRSRCCKAELELALREGRTPEELREAVASAAAESDRLVQLAEDLLVLARADEGRLPVRPEPLDAARAARHDRAPLRGARGRAPAASCAWPTATASPFARTGSAPSRRSRTWWTTRCATATGAVELAAEHAPDGVRLHVLDRGPASTPRSTAAPSSASRAATAPAHAAAPASGLAIVDAIARSHGRSAGAAAREGGGADVWIELPGDKGSDPFAVA